MSETVSEGPAENGGTMEAGHCPRCETPHEPDARFCSRCGYDLSSVPRGPSSSDPPPPSPPRSTTPPTYAWPPPDPGTASRPAPDQKNRRNILIAVAVVVVGVAGVAAALLLARGSSSSVEFPETIAGQPRVKSPALQNIADGVAEQ